MTVKQYIFLEFGYRLRNNPQTAVLIAVVRRIHKDGVQLVLSNIFVVILVVIVVVIVVIVEVLVVGGK